MDGELQRRELLPHDERRQCLPGGRDLLVAPFVQGLEQRLAGLRHRLGYLAIGAADRRLYLLKRRCRLRGVFLVTVDTNRLAVSTWRHCQGESCDAEWMKASTSAVLSPYRREASSL